MKAVILAAGVASRLRPLTNETPKCLLTIGGKTILERTILNLQLSGINDFVIVTGYFENLVREYIKIQFPTLNVKFILNDKYDVTNNIYSLWLTKPFTAGEGFILLDSDIIFDKAIIPLLINSKYQNALALKDDKELGAEEIKVSLTNEGCIKEISKVVNLEVAVGESIGIEKFNSELSSKLFSVLDLMILKEGLTNIFYEAAFERLIISGEKIYPINVGLLKCIELDTAEDLQKAEKEIISDID